MVYPFLFKHTTLQTNLLLTNPATRCRVSSNNCSSLSMASQPKLADAWLDIHGRDDWSGMLDPFNPLLQSELIRYGVMAQACYDAFDHHGSCKYDPTTFFHCLGLSQYGYQVTRYLYATCNLNLPDVLKTSLWPEEGGPTANWIGYVAVSSDETSAHLGRRDIAIAWRGAATRLEWFAALMAFLSPMISKKIPCHDPRIKVESGFLHLYTDKHKDCEQSARDNILAEVKRLVKMYSNEDLSITITGHSLGSSLAILNAYDIAETGLDVMDDGRVVPVCVFSFSGPRVGNYRFKQRLEGLGVKVLRVVNVHDKIPKAPGILFNEGSPLMKRKTGQLSPWCYSHVGVELALDHKNSPFLKETSDMACFHNLEAHLHLLDGYRGRSKRFVLASLRDIAMVNKSCDFLKGHLWVPPNWWERGLKS